MIKCTYSIVTIELPDSGRFTFWPASPRSISEYSVKSQKIVETKACPGHLRLWVYGLRHIAWRCSTDHGVRVDDVTTPALPFTDESLIELLIELLNEHFQLDKEYAKPQPQTLWESLKIE